MLFNSYEFLFVYLPLTLALFYFFGERFGRRGGAAWLILSSLFFYGWWNYTYLLLLALSIVFNYVLGTKLARAPGRPSSKALMIFGVTANIALIAYFKYANFFVDNFNGAFGTTFHLGAIILPLAISFYTFQKIAYLVDAYQGKVGETNFLDYCLFVTFFPQLIAGPIVHYSDVMYQFRRPGFVTFAQSNLAVGLTIFAIGLFKKAILADGIAPFGNSAFGQAETGASLHFFEAWGGALCYTFQLYFDFSGYTDMAIGAARMFGIALPLNFNSPYKATSIIDFWRRWHMTLSRFLRDYLYIPLGGSRHGRFRRYFNLLATMLIGGLWHGAGWTFVVWGALHGLYLVVNHAWLAVADRVTLIRRLGGTFIGRRAAQALTFLAVIVGWVFFRAESLGGAVNMLEGMVGANGVTLPTVVAHRFGPLGEFLAGQGVTFAAGGGTFLSTWLWIGGLVIVAFLFPNTQEIMRRYRPALGFRAGGATGRVFWRPNAGWAWGTAIVLTAGILSLPQVSEFLYFQF